MAEAAAAKAGQGGGHKRHIRNYLLDARFQLKYAGYLSAIAAFLSIVLGLFLWQTSEAVIEQSKGTVAVGERSVAVGEQVVERGREVVAESKKVSAVVQMNIVKDPVYSDNPALLEAFQADAKQQDDRLNEQQDQLEKQSKDLKAQEEALKTQLVKLKDQQRAIGAALTIGLLLMVVGVGLAGIVVTHKVAGPVFKMKRQIRELGEGNLQIPYPLRKGDELRDFFEVFREAVRSLRERQEDEVAKLESAMQRLEGKATAEDLEDLRDLHKHMKDALN